MMNNDFTNGMMTGLGFMNGVGLYNSFFQFGFQKQMMKNQIAQAERRISDRITDAFNRVDMLSAFGGPYGLGHALYRDFLNEFSEEFVQNTITKTVGKDNTHLFWGEAKSEPWTVQ